MLSAGCGLDNNLQPVCFLARSQKEFYVLEIAGFCIFCYNSSGQEGWIACPDIATTVFNDEEVFS